MFFKRKKDKAIPIIIATDSIVMLASAMLAPIYALFVKDIGGSLLDASIVGAVFALAAGFTSLISGKLTDKIKEKEYIVVVGYLCIGIGFVMLTFAQSIWFLFVVQLFTGFGNALYGPAFDTLFSQHTNKHRAGTQWGAWWSMSYFTIAIGALAGGLIATWFGFATLFIIMALLCFGSAIYIFFLPKKVL